MECAAVGGAGAGRVGRECRREMASRHRAAQPVGSDPHCLTPVHTLSAHSAGGGVCRATASRHRAAQPVGSDPHCLTPVHTLSAHSAGGGVCRATASRHRAAQPVGSDPHCLTPAHNSLRCLRVCRATASRHRTAQRSLTLRNTENALSPLLSDLSTLTDSTVYVAVSVSLSVYRMLCLHSRCNHGLFD